MKIVSTSYLESPEYSDPDDWLRRIQGYIGILEALATDHEVFAFERISHKGAYKRNGVHYFFVDSSRHVTRFPFSMHRTIKNLQPDVVLVNGFMFPLQVIQLRMKLGKRVKILLFHRADKPFNSYKKYLQRIADYCVDGYLFASKELGKEWLDDNQIKITRKIYEVIQGSSTFQPLQKEVARSRLAISGSPVFLWVGRLDSNKDPITVVKAFINFLKTFPSARLYMIFQSEELLPAISQMVNEARVETSIILVGKKSNDTLGDWYSAADFIISGSHYEGSGIAVSEAMSCGCIPLVTDIPSFRYMTGGKCGGLYPAGNEKALLDLLGQACEMNIEAERSKVLAQFANELSFSAIAKKINDIIIQPKI
jgi:glycosyltransferase involved in cell wall biosynthesis